MGSLIFNFIKRSLLIPALIAGIAIAGTTVYMNSAVRASEAKLTPTVPAAPDLSGFTAPLFDSYSQLNEGDLIGTVMCEDAGLKETPVCYCAGKSQVSVTEGSVPPWEDGAMLMIGMDTTAQLRAMHNAAVGNELTLKITDREAYRYRITRIDTCVTEQQLNDYLTDNNTLAIAVPYKNLAATTAANMYLVFAAAQL